MHRFAAQAGGKAWLRSAGRSTTITVVLPVAAGYKWPTAGTGGRWSRPVLVIDDEVAIREVAHRVLTSAGYQVMTAANGNEALACSGPERLTANLVLAGRRHAWHDGCGVCRSGPRHVVRGCRYCSCRPTSRKGPPREAGPSQGHSSSASHSPGARLLARVTQMLTADTDASACEQPGQRTRTGCR